ncbi:SHSP domain-containing protein [Forsythia ovata]|uniref:SHSP domain-containing protein n=1 Tax=Forsythia ovata TaxID=205694 RepID=A0ABD1TA73_9LAMI
MALIPGQHGRRRRHIHEHSDPFSDLLNYETLLMAPHAPFHNETRSPLSPRIECKETPEAYIFRTDLPGFKKEEVQVQVEDEKLLKISGEKKVEKDEKHDNWQLVERSRGKFLSAFMLPENCRGDLVKSSMSNGVLTVTMPKRDHPYSGCRWLRRRFACGNLVEYGKGGEGLTTIEIFDVIRHYWMLVVKLNLIVVMVECCRVRDCLETSDTKFPAKKKKKMP